MKKIIIPLCLLLSVITFILYYVNYNDNLVKLFYFSCYTTMIEILFVVWIGVIADNDKMNLYIKLGLISFVVVISLSQIITLFAGHKLLNAEIMSKQVTTILIIEVFVEIVVCFIFMVINNIIADEKDKIKK